MSRTIDTVTLTSIENRRLVLNKAQAAASMDWGNAWTRIRVACRVALSDLGVSPSGIPRFMFGLMSNPTVDGGGNLNNGPLSATTTQFLGFRTHFAMTRNATGPAYRHGTNGAQIHQRIGAGAFVAQNITTGAVSWGWSAVPNGATAYHKVYVMEVTKGSTATNWIGRLIVGYVGNLASVVETTLATLLASLDDPTMGGVAAVLGGGHILHGAQTMTLLNIDEATNGPLNAICVAWDRTDFNAHVADLYAQRFPTYMP